MARLADGDRSAVEPVFRALLPMVLRYCEKLLGPGHDAEDCTQTTLEKLFRQASSYDRALHVSTWALTVATWECRTARRRQSRARVSMMPSEMPSERAPSPVDDGTVLDHLTPEALLIRRELIDSVQQAVGALPENDRHVIDAVVAQFDEPARGHTPRFRKQKQRAFDRLAQLWRSRHEP
jgi:RNA polymerase sigma factor (sigma-70 family)